MPVCCVPFCRGNSRNGAVLYRFPTKQERKTAWMAVIRQPLWEPTKASHVCSKHFEKSCYEEKRADGWRRLKQTAVPTLFSSQVSPKKYEPARSSPKKAVRPFENAEMGSLGLPASSGNKLPETTAGSPVHPPDDEACGETSTASDGTGHQLITSIATTSISVQDNFVPMHSCTDAEVEDAGDLLSPTDSELQQGSTPAQTESLCCLELKKVVADVTRKYNNLQHHHDNAKKKIQTEK
ncbi:peroxynitrite isomerase THAP4-like [Ixodes scapularis]|uniref:peroxynitrite isomerase THAP4-like n=1 Tax=Ixodes scapularis TaxID=6945 RepID=UPI001C38DF71|nr:peroxynitrite isomerase THAP4-like [Ixodes scapularis]